MGEFVKGFRRRAAADRAGHRDRPRAPRPAAAERGPARRLRGAQRPGLDRLGEPGRFASGSRASSASGNVAGGRGGVRLRAAARSAGSPMLEQLEGSQAVATGGGDVPARGHLRLSDLAADAHRRGALRHGPHGRARAVRVPDGGVRVRGDVGLHRRLRRRARAPTPRPRARGCSTWPRRSSTPPASGCRS